MKVERIIVRVPGIQGAIGNIPKADKEFFAEKIKEAQDAAQSATASASDAQSSAQDSSESASSAALSAQSAKEASNSSSEHDAGAHAAQKSAEEARDAAKSAEAIATSKAEIVALSAEQAATSLSLAVVAQGAAKTSQDAAQASADESAKSAKESAQSATSAQEHDESAKSAANAATAAQAASEEARDAAQAHEAASLANANEAKKHAESSQASALESASSASSAAESALEAASAEANAAKHESASANSAQAAQAAQAACEAAKDAASGSATSSLASQKAASESATAASASANASASSASEATESAMNAGASATAANESATKAKDAQDTAESAKSDAEIARDDAQSWASASAGSATSAASSAASASASKTSAEESASSAKESADKIEALKSSIETVAASSANVEKVAGVAESVVSCAENIDAIVATGGTLGLTVSAEAGETVGVEKTLQDGVYNLKFTIPSGGAGSSDSVLYVAQELTDEQKSQARTNISAVGVDASGNVSVTGKLTANSVTINNGRIDIKSGIGSLYSTSNNGVSEVSLATSLSGNSGILKIKSSGVMSMNGTTIPLSINGAVADDSGNVDLTSRFAQLNNSSGCPGFLRLQGDLSAPSIWTGDNQMSSSGLMLANGNFVIDKDDDNYRIKLKAGMGIISAGTFDSVPGVSIKAAVDSGDFKIRANGVLSIGDTYLPKTINGVAADSSGNIEISTSGSSTNVFTEQVTFEQGCKLKKGFELDADTASYDFGYNWDDGTGPGFAMRGAKYTGTGDGAGCFVFWARKDKTSQIKLVGSPTGSLQWNNGNVDVVSSVTKNTATSQTFVVEHQNGFKEMGGYIERSGTTSTSQVTFPKSFSVTPNVQITFNANSSVTDASSVFCVGFVKDCSKDGFTALATSANIIGIYWRACGF